MRAAVVRFYFDEDVLRLGHTVARLRSDATYPGDPGAVVHKRERPECPIAKGTKDPVWVPEVAGRGWLIVTRDFQISTNPAELRAVREHGARIVALSGDDARNTWSQLELFMRRWGDIEAAHEEPGPFIYRASRTRWTSVDLTL